MRKGLTTLTLTAPNPGHQGRDLTASTIADTTTFHIPGMT